MKLSETAVGMVFDDIEYLDESEEEVDEAKSVNHGKSIYIIK